MPYTTAQIAALNKLAGYSNVTNNIATPSPTGQGLYRQTVSPVPDVVSSFELQKYQASGASIPRQVATPQLNAALSQIDAPQVSIPKQQIVTPKVNSTVAQPNIPTRLANFYNSQANNSELVRAARAIQNSPITARVGNAAASLGNAANRVTGVLAVGAIAANYARNPNTENGLRGALAVATVAFAGVPYVNAALFAVNLGVAAYDVWQAFKSPNNLVKGGGLSTGFLGGQSVGVAYNILVQMTFDDGVTAYSWGFNQASSVAALQPQKPPYQGAILGARYERQDRITNYYFITSNGEILGGYFFNSSTQTPHETVSFSILQINRVDGQPETDPQAPVIVINNDGSERPDLAQVVQDNLDQVQGKLDILQQIAAANNLDLQQIKDLVSLPRNNNNVTPLAIAANPIAAIPKPLPAPANAVNPTVSGKANTDAIAPNRVPAPVNNDLINRLNQQIRETQALAVRQTQTQTQTQTINQNERFKQPSDCQFSCENLAKCFVDLKVNIFDGCNAENGTAKTKEITIQVLPKDKAKTEASFKELLDIRSRECSLTDRVLVVPDYWQTRVGQRPQAGIVYREFVNGKFTDSYYTLHIPHYTGTKGVKPQFSQYTKGTVSATYTCKDNSKMRVNASTEAEAVRILNEMEKYVNPRFRADNKDDAIRFGKWKGAKKTTVKPIRLDFFSTGQSNLSPDWSIPL